MSNIILKAHNATQSSTVLTLETESGRTVVIKAASKTNYEIIDEVTGTGPQQITLKRVGNDLHLNLDETEATADLVIQDYYLNSDQDIIGTTDSGLYHSYIPASDEATIPLDQIQNGSGADYVLAQESMSSPLWVDMAQSAISDNSSWLLGLGALGVAGIALGSNNSDNDNGSIPDPTNSAPTLTITATNLHHVKVGQRTQRILLYLVSSDIKGVVLNRQPLYFC